MKHFITTFLLCFIYFMGKAQTCPLTSYNFTTQAQLNNFAATSGGCTQILGNLVINGLNITDLSPLSNITTVGTSLWVYNTSITNLNGLNAITDVAADFVVQNNVNLQNANHLTNLNSVGRTMAFEINNNLTDLTGLSQLKKVGLRYPQGGVHIYNNPALASLSFNDLDSVIGYVYIAFNPMLQTIAPFSNLDSIGGLLAIASNASLQNLNIFPQLKSIASNLFIVENNSLLSLGSWSNLDSIGGYFAVQNNPQLSSLGNFNALQTIDSFFNVNANALLVDFGSFNSLNHIGGYLNIVENPLLQDLNIFPQLESIASNLFIGENNSLLSLGSWSNLDSIGGYFIVFNNNLLSSLGNFNALRIVDSYFYIGFNNNLVDLGSFNSLNHIGNYLSILENPLLQDMSGIGNLQSINGSLNIRDNYSLSNLNNFGALQSINGDLRIRNNNALTDISGIQNIDPNTISIGQLGDGLSIDGNGALSVCHLNNICTYLAYPSGTHPRNISGNLGNCADENSIYASCGISSELPGSGNAISFDGDDDYVSINSSQSLSDFTVEFWISNNGTDAGYDRILSSQNFNFEIAKSSTHLHIYGNDLGLGWYSNITDLPLEQWLHIAAVRAGNTLTIYKNGIAVHSIACGTASIGSDFRLGGSVMGGEYANCTIDEFRTWNTALTQSQIRDRMCRKITDADPLYASLAIYFNFDEMGGTSIIDQSLIGGGATIYGATRIRSAAPIGDASAHDYVNATKTVSLAHASGENLVVSSASGSPDAIHVYRVDELPNTINGTAGLGGNDKYFGVFQVGGTNPEYDAEYHYAGNPGVDATNESTLAIYSRANNAATTWSSTTTLQDMVNKTLTLTGQSTEYVLGSSGNPLPMNLLSFNGNNTVEGNILNWELSTSNTLQQSVLERSDDGIAYHAIAALPYQNTTKQYQFLDENLQAETYYYRLALKSLDGKTDYSHSIKLRSNGLSRIKVFPNPTESELHIVGLTGDAAIVLVNIAGQVVHQTKTANKETKINMQHLPAGVYILKANGETFRVVKK